ncbi:hypothetical protein [Paraferrimonas haliotis]|uniref:Outer membrane lipoprotein SlyB n=1 Tax=Paraferrimonas haliotis TaxID=2013866 RepID=A0AA37TZ40_9GAMM|nr:hypothetical protein [Paraferrimonas haliotis]GLS83846.1 hypothetical protein GCM10007894_18230 [Paraferrimonas haliotis]GLS83973.1 hypothetical protein GCM10007894_19500 [Paraferrimonas haliotis]
MKKLIACFAIVLTMNGCAANNAQQYDPNQIEHGAYAVDKHRGVIIDSQKTVMSPSEMRETTQTALGVAAGGALIAAASRSDSRSDAGAAVATIGLAAAILSEIGNDDVEVVLYTVELQDGRLVEIPQADTQALPLNSKVMVTAYNNGQTRVRIDESQQRIYNRTQDTIYAD